jgi:2-methylcitrate dehydratase PrpD
MVRAQEGFAMELTAELSRFVAGLRVEDLPPAVVEQTKLCILDLLGVALRGRVDADSSAPITAAIDELAPVSGPCTVLGADRGYPPQYAAFLHSTYGHSLDFDDTHAGSSLHPGAPTIPAALAAGEVAGTSGAAFLAAVVAGYEVTCRLAEALPPRVHYDRGFHPTATAGNFGAAAAATLADGGDAAAVANVWGLVLSMAAGTMQFMDNGSWNKRLQVGWAAHNGVVAAVLHRQGVVGATYPLEGRHGFLRSYSPDPVPEQALVGLGERWKVTETAIKPYPCCRYIHSALDGLIALATDEDLRPEHIETIEVGMCAKGVELVGRPAERKQDPHSVVDGQFSMFWAGAVAATRRRLTWSEYDLLRDPTVLDLARRTTVTIDPEADANYPRNWSARVRVRTPQRMLERFVLRPTGEPEAPLSAAQVEAKFHGLAETVLDKAQRDAIVATVRNVERLDSVRHLADTLRPTVLHGVR